MNNEVISPSSMATPTLFPVKDQVHTIPTKQRAKFMHQHLNKKFAIFESFLYLSARMLNEQYQGDYWEFASIKISHQKEIFFCYPSEAGLVAASNPMNYAEGVMDNMTFGLICTIIALSNAFYEVGDFSQNELYWCLEELKSWLFDELYQQMEKLTDAQKANNYRRFMREVAKFID